MPKPMAPSKILKKLPRGCGPARPRQEDRSGRDRGLVFRRGPCRTEEQDHPALGQARFAPLRAARSTHRLDLYLRRDLPQGRQGRGPCLAPLQHRGDEPASGRDRAGSGAGWSRSARPRPGRLAPVRQAHRAAEYHARPAAAQVPRTQSGRECLAVHPRQLPLQPRLPLLRRHSRTLLLCLEQPRRPALDNHVNRVARLGAAVLIKGTWYEAADSSFSGIDFVPRSFAGGIVERGAVLYTPEGDFGFSPPNATSPAPEVGHEIKLINFNQRPNQPLALKIKQ